MRVVLTSFGSTGDIYPLIALGKALQKAGHEAVYATAPLFQEDIEAAGLEYFRMPPDWEQGIFTEFMRALDRISHPLKQLRHIYREAMPFIPTLIDRLEEACEGADLVVGSYMFSYLRVVPESLGIPFAAFFFTHNFVPCTRFPPDPMPRLRGWPPFLTRPIYRFQWAVAEWLVDRTLNGVLQPILEDRNFPPMEDFLSHPADLALVGMSPILTRHRGIANHRIKPVGFIRWQAVEDPELEKELLAFTEGALVPVITFGSVAFDDVHGIMSRFLHRWPEGRKVILQRGWAGLSVELARPYIKIVDKMSHDQLFRHASCVIHHGGAGTTATVLSAGKPQIIIPHIADQPFFASEIKRLGVGVRVKKQRWPELLPRAVRTVTRRKRYKRKAQRLAWQIRREDGPGKAVELLERFVREHRGS